MKDLALEDFRKLTPWSEMSERYSKSVLYDAYAEYAPEMRGDVEDARRRLTEVKAALSGAETQLKKVNMAVVEAGESARVVKY